ncbi:class I SAM-dependent methyltransferase [Ideonella sp. BN130291]|uniref:class I SAM-dependent methyltransferase n=1 Tax=Ideonella sp. BN130291 TaxID=3112940 RepID=UPI002E264982|nr:SAM-dependent methyltransferase [Ideonella sp. BN130291]
MHKDDEPDSVSAALAAQLRTALSAAGGWLPFDRFMALVLYTPGLGYYANGSRKFGWMPSSGSDFVTAPELSPLFARALARQVAQALEASGTDELWEFGAGSGALAEQLLQALGDRVRRYTIVDLSGALRQRQQERLAAFGQRVQWADTLPTALRGVVVGNEVLDAMPVTLLHWTGEHWLERGVVAQGDGFAWSDRSTALRPPVDGPFLPGTVTEVHRQAEAFITTLAEHLQQGAAFFMDYGFPEDEYYHPQRTGGTLMCHRAHQADTDPLVDLGLKDITAHVNFTGIALAGQAAGLDVLGYTSQGRFLINCGLAELLQGADVRTASAAHKLIAEHEMGELFKVIGFAKGCRFDAIGFAAGDRSHRL